VAEARAGAWLHARSAVAARARRADRRPDAETEHALFERFAAAAEATDGRITILVSHRFSTVRMADQIVVLDGSRLVEVGSHPDLLAREGQYAELYTIQAAAYR
jgi:ATP-binding cassette subfamily B protein